MLRRLIFENWAILCTLIAFATALSIFLFIGYRALRMSRKDASRIANIPLDDDEHAVLANRDNKSSGKDGRENESGAGRNGGSGSSVARADRGQGGSSSHLK